MARAPRRRRQAHLGDAVLGPHSVEEFARRVRCGDTWCETLVVTGYPRSVGPGWLQPLLAYPGTVDVALHVDPLEAATAAAHLRRQTARFESTRRLQQGRDALVDPGLEAAASDAHDLAARLARGEDRLFKAGLYITVRARSEEELEREVAKVQALAASLMLEVQPAVFRALAGVVSTVPLGLDALRVRRTFDTRALATTFPFACAEIAESDGVLMGRNSASGALVCYDRFSHPNHNQVVLAESGAGKSYLAKLLVLRSLVRGIDVLVVDPEDEYGRLARAVGGTVIDLGRGGRINPLDVGHDGDGVTERALFCHTLAATLLGGMNADERAELDRALLAAYGRAGITSDPATQRRPAPLLADVVAALGAGDVARSLCARLERFVSGSARALFDAATSAPLESHLVVISLRHLPSELRAAGTLIGLDAIWRRVRAGTRAPRLVVVDEAWVLLADGDDSGARFLARLAKSARKHWCGLVTVTQNVTDVCATDLGRVVLTNASSSFLLHQSGQGIDALGDTFGLSDGERAYLRGCRRGHGLHIVANARAPVEVLASREEHALVTSDPAELALLEDAP